MDQTLKKACKILDINVPEAQEWQLAEHVLNYWDVPKLGEDLAREVIFRIVNHVQFPTEDMAREIVGEAENKGIELFPEIGDRDPHMAVYEWLENKYRSEKTTRESKPR